MLLLVLLPTLSTAQWRGQMMGQFPPQGGQFGYPQMPQGNGFDMGMYASPYGQNSQIQPGLVGGYGGFNPQQTWQPREEALNYPGSMPLGLGGPQPSSYPFPSMAGIPNRMGGAGIGDFSPQGLNPMAMPRPITHLGSFQADSINRDIEKPMSSLQPTRVIPPFMRTATPQQLDQFYAIVQNPMWSPSEKQQKIEEFVRSMDTNSQNIFASYSRATENETEVKRQKVHKAVDQMSPEAQVQFQKVSAVMTNTALNETDRLQKIQDIYAKVPDEIKKEFDQKLANL